MTGVRSATTHHGRALAFPDALWKSERRAARPADPPAAAPRTALVGELALHARAAAIMRAAAARGEGRPRHRSGPAA